jgi:endonuclease/exonuclease/phosphatase family metal-dependent hydrolase
MRAHLLVAAMWVWALAAAAPAAAQAFVVATYNLRYDTPADGANAWPHRQEAVKALVQRHGIDLLATQEGLIGQVEALGAMPGWAWVGAGRDDGRRAGEHAAIFFRTARFQLLGQGTFWLSETPDVPSKGWDGRCCHRIASWARLLDRSSQRRFFVFSAHFDHEGVVARRESAHLLLRRARQIAIDEPLLVLGDLNATPNSEAYAILSSGLRDARLASLAPPTGPVGTFNGFQLDAPLRDRIDYIFVSPPWQVQTYTTLADTVQGRYPSDHLPVLVRVQLD